MDYLRTLDSPHFPIPALKDDLDWRTIQVAKGTFDIETSCLPDPFLLMAKAAVNFSSLVGKKLMPACKHVNFSEEADDDSDSF